MAQKHATNSGFTVVELLVSTTVFSIILLVCSIALIQIGRTFTKGITVTKTDEVARSVIDDISNSIAFSSGSVNQLTANNGSQGYCVGNVRYSFYPYRMLPDSGATHSFVADRLDKAGLLCSSGTLALDLSAPLPTNTDAHELLGPRMRVAKFSVAASGGASSGLYVANIRIVKGEDDILVNPGGPTANCTGSLTGAQYCAAVELTTTIQKRVQ